MPTSQHMISEICHRDNHNDKSSMTGSDQCAEKKKLTHCVTQYRTTYFTDRFQNSQCSFYLLRNVSRASHICTPGLFTYCFSHILLRETNKLLTCYFEKQKKQSRNIFHFFLETEKCFIFAIETYRLSPFFMILL